MTRMASGRRSHRVAEDYQGATAAVHRVDKSFSAVSSAWELSSPSTPTHPQRKSEAHRRNACGARPIARIRAWDGGHRGVADSQGVIVRNFRDVPPPRWAQELVDLRQQVVQLRGGSDGQFCARPRFGDETVEGVGGSVAGGFIPCGTSSSASEVGSCQLHADLDPGRIGTMDGGPARIFKRLSVWTPIAHWS